MTPRRATFIGCRATMSHGNLDEARQRINKHSHMYPGPLCRGYKYVLHVEPFGRNNSISSFTFAITIVIQSTMQTETDMQVLVTGYMLRTLSNTVQALGRALGPDATDRDSQDVSSANFLVY
jgi:hypothetical protein